MIAVGALLAVGATACGSSSKLPRNGLIAAHRDGDLYVLNPDGSRQRRIPRLGPAVWTPDGTWLAYNTYREFNNSEGSYSIADLWLVRPDGTGRHLVARNVPLGPFSPDGKTIAFSNDSCLPDFTAQCEVTGGNHMELYTIGVDGRGLRRLTHNLHFDGDPSWSPDGRRLVFSTLTGTRIVDRDGTHSHVLTKGDWTAVPQWSPAGDEILISTARGWGVVSPDGGDVRYLERGPRGPEFGASWSPDGKRIVYLFRRARTWTAHDPLQLWVMNADGTGRRRLTRSFGWGVPSWAPAARS